MGGLAEPTHFYFIRHGDATYAVDDAAPALTPLGVIQAERLRDRLAVTREIQADVLIASTMRRAVVTAEIIQPALGLPLVLDKDVEEIRSGEAQGVVPEERGRRWGKPVWLKDPRAAWAPGAESPYAFTQRVVGGLARLAEEHVGKRVVVVCHGGVIRTACLYFQGLDGVACTWPGPGMIVLPEHRETVGRSWVPSLGPANTSITHWRTGYSPLAERPTWNLEVFNDAFHLRDLHADDPSKRINWQVMALTEPESQRQPERNVAMESA